eukprot:Skav214565  [mRNA]  locus=scaffold2080:58717:60748:+ [translate_table: standard]
MRSHSCSMVAASNLPAPLTNGELVSEASLEDVPSAEDLAQWLVDRGLDTADWGKDNTKDVGKFWKVTSPDRYQRGIFLFNTWQQYGDGRTRTRNGLLSEKLTTAEMPLEENLHEVR